ncbi:MAG: DNA (cytosine-5-)-methyltransferase, partial [Marinobacter sp.]
MKTATTEKGIRFIDLFAGLGGFHVGVSQLGHRCVFASELDEGLRDIYAKNFCLAPEGDIRRIDERLVPDHELICAGFPCQPFSRAGKKKGAKCPSSGRLVDEIFRIAEAKQPKYIMLENVPDVISIEEGKFWEYLVGGLARMGYEVDYKVYTPREFGIPQKRKRIFIVACKSGLQHFKWPAPEMGERSLRSIALKSNDQHNAISKEKEFALSCWQDFISQTSEFTSLPILASEFGATYPYNKKIKTVKEMSAYKGAFGVSLQDCKTWASVQEKLPKHSRNENGKASPRVAEAIQYSREIYNRHSVFLELWKNDLKGFPSSWTKFEWQGDREQANIWKHIIQFRASGIRIIKPDCAPSLIAMSTTQTPILGEERRYMSIKEAAALQSLDMLDFFPDNNSKAFKALGNAVNALIVKEIAKELI